MIQGVLKRKNPAVINQEIRLAILYILITESKKQYLVLIDAVRRFNHTIQELKLTDALSSKKIFYLSRSFTFYTSGEESNQNISRLYKVINKGVLQQK